MMTKSIACAVALITTASVPARAAGALAALACKARPVVVFADAADDASLRAQLTRLTAAHDTLRDYDLAVVSVPRPRDRLRAKLGVAARGFAVVLVGKDGSVKATWRAPVEVGRIVALVDAMPMRRDEVRQRRRDAEAGQVARR